MMLASIAEVQPVLAKGKYGPVPMLSDKVIKTVETRETLRGQADLNRRTKRVQYQAAA